MTTPATNTLLTRSTHPIRKPYVRDASFIDGIGPPPFGFFDETQDHLGAYFHALLGWRYSADCDEFTEASAPINYLGRMRISDTFGCAEAPATSNATLGEHGVWSVLSFTSDFRLAAQGASVSLDGDFLFTAKVKIVNRGRLETVSSHGFMAAIGSLAETTPHQFVAGSDQENWAIQAPVVGGGGVEVYSTDVPVVDGAWYRLQISRVAGAIRWFINGLPIVLRSADPDLNGLTGQYYPDRIVARKFLYVARSVPGPANDGFYVDSCHLYAERLSS
ncbi:MAG: hypothetical protein E6Q97_36265 [Desulfurellales bacterium]|nr:MAG: hypothetical protein E6Q97_36265 [Desulfurellales bacterium]